MGQRRQGSGVVPGGIVERHAAALDRNSVLDHGNAASLDSANRLDLNRSWSVFPVHRPHDPGRIAAGDDPVDIEQGVSRPEDNSCCGGEAMENRQ
jgi:hypothetical protein